MKWIYRTNTLQCKITMIDMQMFILCLLIIKRWHVLIVSLPMESLDCSTMKTVVLWDWETLCFCCKPKEKAIFLYENRRIRCIAFLARPLSCYSICNESQKHLGTDSSVDYDSSKFVAESSRQQTFQKRQKQQVRDRDNV